MEERYEVMTPSLNGYAYIQDLKTDNVLNTYDSCNLLNQQDKELSKLRASYQQVKEENDQLKQSQRQLAVEELEKIKKFCDEKYFNPGGYRLKVVSLDQIEDFLDDQIKELKGEE